MTTDRSTLAKAIRRAIGEARLAYEFSPNSYTASALNAALAVEQALLAAQREAHQHDDIKPTEANHNG